MTVLRHALPALAILALTAVPAFAGQVTLRVNPVDDDGRVTLGDLFDGAGAASGVVVAQRSGPSVVLEAAQLQMQARQAGLDWANPNGLRRVAVRRASAAPVAASRISGCPDSSTTIVSSTSSCDSKNRCLIAM